MPLTSNTSAMTLGSASQGAGQSDQDHGERWMWVRDAKEGKGALQHAANGPLSLRLFKDGGYARMTAVNVEPTPMQTVSEAPNPKFWDL